MALNLEALTAEVERVKTVQESAVTLLLALASELEEISANLHECHSNTADLEALDALTIKLRESTDALANAIDASDDVISEPEPVVEEPVEPEPVDPEVEEPVDEEPVVEEPTDPEVDPVEEPEAPVEGEGDEAVEDEAVQAPFDASGIPGAEGTQSGEAVDREKE